MARYNVKQVIKLAERADKLKDKTDSDYCSAIGSLSVITVGMGGIIATYQDVAPVLSYVAASVFAAGGIAMFLDMITAEARKSKLDHKLDKIYESMGPDFESYIHDAVVSKTRS